MQRTRANSGTKIEAKEYSKLFTRELLLSTYISVCVRKERKSTYTIGVKYLFVIPEGCTLLSQSIYGGAMHTVHYIKSRLSYRFQYASKNEHKMLENCQA